ncbi:MAG: NAD-dependent succinate-semialdehyde dehydrogenase [Candidatus Saccharimonadales bacterium]
MALRSINPTTEEVIQEFDELSAEAIEQKLALAQSTFETWRNTSFEERATLMHKAAQNLRDSKAELALVMTREVGKTLTASEAEIEKCALTCDYYADNAATFLSEESVETDAGQSYVRFDPIGVVLAVMPWNFPLWQVFRFAAPALMAGNVGILKHASNVQMSGQAIEKVFVDAGFPEGAFLNLEIGSAKVEAIIRDPRVKAATLTGSEYAGSQVAKVAGEEIKKTVLELGGSDPFIVFADADIDQAVSGAVTGRMQFNAGQSCIAAKRFIVEESIASEFADKLTTAVEELVVGDPESAETSVGPLASKQQLDDIEKQVTASVEAGATLLCGGKRKGGKGYFYEPAVLANVTKGMPVYDEEVFGPALPIISFKTNEEAIAIANDSEYGLGATIFSSDTNKAQNIARDIDSGAVFINNPVKSDPRLPFGGVKKSGYGRELSHYGIREFVNVKTVWIK